MTRTKYTQEQILGVLKEADAGTALPEILRKHGIGQDAFYRWKRLYGGLQREELVRVRALEEGNKRLKARDCRPGAEHPPLARQAGKTLVTAAARRAVVAEWRAVARLSERRACRFLGVGRSTQRSRGREQR